MVIVDAGVHNSNSNARTRETFFMESVDTRHTMWCLGV
jgi:hypothetical protein